MELGPLLGCSPTRARTVLFETLNLYHRHPSLWAAKLDLLDGKYVNAITQLAGILHSTPEYSRVALDVLRSKALGIMAHPAVALAMLQTALGQCGLAAQDIDLIKVQAAGSPVNDAVEAQGLRAVFPVLPALVSLKPAIGHTMGASGAAEIALLMACLAQGEWPVCAHAVDEALDVHCPAQPPPAVRRVMATILGFGGGHATVVLERT